MEGSSPYHYQDDDKKHLPPGKYLLLQIWTCDLTQGHIMDCSQGHMDCFDEQMKDNFSVDKFFNFCKFYESHQVQDFTSTFLQVVSMEIFASFMKVQKVFLQTFHARNILQVSEVIIVRGSVLVTEPG